jgi:amino acid adenylation domain-containing protein
MTREITTAQTIDQLLLDRAARVPEQIALRVLGDGETVTAELSYQALLGRAEMMAAAIAERCARGDRALILHDNDEHYAVGFYGCLLAGVIAVPAFPPEASRKQAMERLRGIARDARPALVLTSAKLAPAVRTALDELALSEAPGVLISDEIFARPLERNALPAARRHAATTGDVAFLQYTSGSTGAPRGVMVSHGNILANERAISQAFGASGDDVIVSWLPLYHDMGLIGGLMQPLFLGGQLVLMTPEHFGASPARWIKAISRFGGTISGGPDFAYRMCLERLRPYQLEGLSLESWKVAFCGAEPIRAETLTAFADQLAPYGFSRRALYPCYGLAEATLLVSGGARGGGAVIERFDADALASARAERSDAPGESSRALVGCGTVALGHAVTIAWPESEASGAPVPDGVVGEVLVQGPSVTAGYWQNEQATAALFARLPDGPGALRTGDLGFFHRGQLFITGRRKDLLIIRGQNLYPQDIEATVGAEVEVIRAGRIAAFAVDTTAGEGIGVAVELSKRTQKLVPAESLFAAIGEAVAEAHGDPPALILLLEPATLPMTSSGKLRRSECLRAWRAGTLRPYAVFERGKNQRANQRANERAGAAPTVARLCRLLGEVLGVAEVHADDSFFTLGGSSLAGMQLAARIGEEFGVAAPLRALLTARTVAALATLIDERAAQGPAAAATATALIATIDRAGDLPLSPGEQRLWFLHQLEPHSAAYHLAGTMAISGPVAGEAVAAALTQLVARHEILRTNFGAQDDRPVRTISPPWRVELPLVDLRGPGDRAEAQAELARLIEREAHRPFDLAADRLLRATLVRTGEDEHVLVAVLHHIVADGWSMDVLRRELAQHLAQETPPPLPLQVADYAAWQAARKGSPERAAQLAYWRDQLSGERTSLPLPRSRAAAVASAAATSASGRDPSFSFSLDLELTRALRAVARAHGTTLYAALLGGLQLVLHRYTGQDDVWIGAPIANRQPAVERLIGFFVNTCALRTRVEPRLGFADHLGRVHDTLTGALAHAEAPFQHVLEDVGAPREADQQGLFQVFYNHLAPEYTAPLGAAGLTLGPIRRASYAADFDLVLDTAEHAGGIDAVFTYRAGRIDDAAVARLAGHYTALLTAAVADPGAPIARLPLLSAAERAALRSWNADGAAPNARRERACFRGLGGLAVHQEIARHAALTPDAVAVRHGDASMSYAELDAGAERWAQALRDAGTGRDALVGVYAEPSFELVIGLVAALKAGAAFLALDPSYPAERLAFMMRDARPAAILVQAHLRGDVLGLAAGSQGEAATILSFADEPALAAADPHAVTIASDDGAVCPDALAYCIYTSGSTGVPKAALLTHGGLANHLGWMRATLPAGAPSRVLQTAPSGFDAAVAELFLPLVSGGACVLASRDDARDPARLLELISRHAITLFISVPSLLELVVEAPGGEAALARLVCLGSGGEALTAHLAARLASIPGVAVWNLYGPTEITIDATGWRVTLDDLGGDAPIGRPITNATAHVLDASLGPVPAGGVGELYVGGAGLARGYLGRPDATADRFVPDPFSAAPGARLYRTGDLVRRRADGAIEYLGRADGQVKLHGHRIELGELIARLSAAPEIRQTTVVVREDVPGKRQLVAYLVLTDEARALPEAAATLREELPARLGRELPHYMVPRAYVLLDALPVLPSGKLDRKALPPPDLGEAQADYVAPRTEVERTLAAIWQAVLGVPRLGLHDNFFALGGDSIVAIQVVGKARAARLCISPRDIFRHQTVGALAQVATAIPDDDAGAALVAPAAGDGVRFPLARLSEAELAALPHPLESIEDILPLTPMQEGMLLHTLLEPGSGIYLMQDRYRVESELAPAAFLAAWDAVVARHSALRASFWQLGDKTLQIIHRQVTGATEYLDLRGLPAHQQDARIDELLADERRRGFDFAAAPLLRLRLFQLADQAFVYVESHHHILMDDWCRSLLFLDFFAAYGALLEGKPPQLPPAPRHGDHVAWLCRQDRSAALAHWEETLAGVEAATPLALDRPQTAAAGASRVGYASVTLSVADTQQIAQTARRLRLTANTLAQGAWASTLAHYAGHRDVVFGVTVSGRHPEVPGVEDMVGIFVNTIPLRVQLPAPGDPTSVARWLAELQDTNLGHRLYEHVPLVEIAARTALPRGEELFRSLFVFENAPLDPSLKVRAAELRFRLQENRTHTNYPLTVVVIPGEQMKLVLSYDARLFEAADLERLVEQLHRVLLAIAKNPEQPVAALSPLSAEDRQQQLVAWNATARDHQLHRGFAERLAERARAQPERAALRHQGQILSYAELARRAHRTAWALAAHGVAPGDFVGVYAERGLDQIALLCGVLAAGAAYVALDVRHPDDRIAHIAGASGAKVVLSTAASTAALDGALATIAGAGDSSPRPRRLSWPEIAAGDFRDDDPQLPTRPEQLAYVIYTSGSTGTPKGAMVTLAGMLNNQLSKVPYFQLSEGDVIAQTAAPSFDISVWQMLTGLLCGALIEIVPDDVAGDPRALLAHVRAAGVTILESVPALIQEMLIAEAEGSGAESPSPASSANRTKLPLRFLLPTGEALPPEVARQWLRRFPQVPLVNAYGPAECADDVALCTITQPPPADLLRMPIGTPTDNTRLYVLDASLRLVPVGVTGQLCVAGVGVGHGYLADPARTAAVFIPHPFGGPGERLYLTGDLARFTASGVLEYVGRVDHQVKLRGHRIELGEIEARLLELPGVTAAAVALRQDLPGQPRLVGYVTLDEGGPADASAVPVDAPAELRTRLAAVLPAIMVPQKLVVLAALPLSANGKLDRKALPAPDDAGGAAARYAAPRTELETQLCGIWADALGITPPRKVGIDDNFFDLGGHSLLITRVAARIRNELGFDVPLRSLFEAQSVAAVAEIIERSRPRASVAELAAMSDLLDELEQI